MMKRRRLAFALIITSFLLVGIILPAVYSSNGVWRLINPTEFSPNVIGKNNVNGIYALNGNTGSINSGNAAGVWAVGDQGFIFDWDGFSWQQAGISPSGCQLNSVNFGGPLIPSGSNFGSISSSSGWIVGGKGPGQNGGAGCPTATALYNGGTGWTPYEGGLAGTDTLNSVSLVPGAGSVEAWAVGSTGGAGQFWHWFGNPGSGVSWSLVNTFPGTPVKGIYMTHCCTLGSADDGWAVGLFGKVYRWFGGAWSVFQTVNPSSCGPVPDLFSVAMDSTTDGWAVGSCGSIYHFSSGTWNGPVSAGTTINDLVSITLLSNNEGWAVGNADGTGPTILHGTNLAGTPNWIRIPVNHLPGTGSGATYMFTVNFAVSGNNIWASGQGGLMLLCASGCSDSSFWGSTTSPVTTALESVFMTGTNDGWAVGLASLGMPTIFHWDGSTFTRGTATAGAKDLYGVWMTSSSEGWAVGGTGASEATVHFTGGTWTDVLPPGCACLLNGIYMASSSNGWAVGAGAGPTGKIEHLSSSPGPWMINPNLGAPASPLFSVFFDPADSNSGWAVGGPPSVIIHTINGGLDGFANAIFTPGGIPAGVSLRSIFMLDNTHIWVVGTGSTILFSGNDGATWSQQLIAGPVFPPIDLNGVFLDSNTDGWAVGVNSAGNAAVIHWDGTSWTDITYPFLFFNALKPETRGLNGLIGVALTSSTNGLAVGARIIPDPTTLGFVLHLDPPGLYGGGTTTAATTSATSTTTTSVVTSTSVVTTTSSASSSSTATTSSSSSSTGTSSTSSTSSSTEMTTSTSTMTGSSTETATATSTATESSTSTNVTPLQIPGIPGFPWESIIAGIFIGVTALVIIRRRRALPVTR